MTNEKLKLIFDKVCLIEIFSCFLLFCIAMPLKYGFGIEKPMFSIGLFHGLAFMVYIALAFRVRKLYHWKSGTFISILLFGIIPFATWFTHKKIQEAKSRI